MKTLLCANKPDADGYLLIKARLNGVLALVASVFHATATAESIPAIESASSVFAGPALRNMI